MARLTVLLVALVSSGCGGGDPGGDDADRPAGDADLWGIDADRPDSGDAEADIDAEPDRDGDQSPTDADADADIEDDLDAEADAEADADFEADFDAEADTETVEEPPLFDLDLLRDPAAADCRFTDHRVRMAEGALLDVWSVRFNSIEVVDGEVRPIAMRAFAARPVGSASLPGVVQAHGLGGFAEESHATATAGLLSMFVIAYTGPGGGTEPANTSEGLPADFDEGRRMFDTIPDRRGSWFWAHAAAAIRALTCLETRDDVDPARLGITGFSAGGVVSLIVAGADDRIVASVPLSGTLRWEVATESPTAWQHNLLTLAGYDTSSPEWLRLMEWMDAETLLGATGAAVMMINGSSDEFFPLTAHMATFDGLGPGDHRLSFAGNFDHGCSSTGLFGEDGDTIAERAELRTRGGQRAWFRHAFGTDDRYGCMPATPELSLTPMGPATTVVVAVDESCPRLRVDEVRVWWSGDGAATFLSTGLGRQAPGLYGELTGFPTSEATVAYADVVYRTDYLIFPERFSLSSRPTLAPDFVPRIRTMPGTGGDCLPPP